MCIFSCCQKLEGDIEEIAPFFRVGSVIFLTEQLRLALITEARNWKLAYAKALNKKCGQEIVFITDFVDNLMKLLSRPIKDLEDVRSAMASLNEIRDKAIYIDMTVSPIEEAYSLLNKYNIFFSDGNAEKVDSLSYGWKKLTALVSFYLA